MRNSNTTVLLVLGGLLAGCGEIVPSISETKDLPRGIPSGPLTVVTGPGKRSASFVAGDSTQKQDFLFVFDDSGSMGDEVTAVQNELANFFAALNARRDVDYRVGVTTTNAVLDNGMLYQGPGGQRVLTPATSNVIGEFASVLDQIKWNIQHSGSRPWGHYEMGWLAAEKAITNHGASFMRDGVPLAVVILTDAADSSRSCVTAPNGTISCSSTPYPVSRFVDYFRNLKTASQVPVTSLLYPLAARYGVECDSLEGSEADWTSLGSRYNDVQTQVGTGFLGSICESLLPNYLTEIGRRISSRGICYDLTGGPTAILSVTVAGSPVAESSQTGYQFDATTGSLCFAGTYQPNAGATIAVNYEVPN